MPDRLPIIGFDANSWAGSWMNRQELLSRLAARGWPVIYSNGALSLWDRGSDRWRDSGWRSRFIRSNDVHVDLPGRLVPRWQSQKKWDRWMMRHHTRRLRDLAGDDVMVYIFNPIYFEQVEYLNPKHVLFHVRDFYPGVGSWTRCDQYRLDALADRADLITVAGKEMSACIPASASKKIRLLPNATDPSAFVNAATLQCPDDLVGISGPRIGLIGNITPKTDLALMLRIARERPKWQFVVIGPVMLSNSDGFQDHSNNWRACLDTANIHYLGPRDHAYLPTYMVQMDVNIIPNHIPEDRSSWIHFTNPLKMFSCLAAGKPVISSDIPAVREFADVIEIVKDPADWTLAIERAVSSGGIGTPRQRQAIAFQNTWDNRVDDLEGWLFQLLLGNTVESPAR